MAPVTRVLAIVAMVLGREPAPFGQVIQRSAVSATGDIAIVCDSTSYLPDQLIDECGAQLVSLYVSVGGDQRREREIGDYGAFFERLRASDEGATTSQPSIGDFIEVYGRCSTPASRSSRSTSPPGSRGPTNRPSSRGSG